MEAPGPGARDPRRRSAARSGEQRDPRPRGPGSAAPARGRPGEGPAPRLPRSAPPLPVLPPPAGAALPARRGVRGTAPVPTSGGGETYLCSARGHGSPGAAGAAGAAAAGARASPPLFVCEGPRAALSRDVTGPCVISAQGHRAPTRRGQRHPPPRGRGRGGRERGWGGRAARSSPVPWLPTPRPPRHCHWERARFPLETPRRARPAAHSVPRGQRPRRRECHAPAPRHALPWTPRPHVGPPPLGDTAPRDGAGTGGDGARSLPAAAAARKTRSPPPPSPAFARPGRSARSRVESQAAGRARARAGEAAAGAACPRQVAASTWPRAGTLSRIPPRAFPTPTRHSRPAAATARLRQNRGDPGHPQAEPGSGRAAGEIARLLPRPRPRPHRSRKSVPTAACPRVSPGQLCGRSWGTRRELLAHTGCDTRTPPLPGPAGSGPRRCPELAAPVGALPARLYVTLTRVSVHSAKWETPVFGAAALPANFSEPVSAMNTDVHGVICPLLYRKDN
ncbi:basic proline-rich protein-like [Ammospiza nelsoni]|uniref:basic proline-rich protein-like n=1 Tax=Ammospiza nelsoni TaxID=2857394 RepID=UPI00286BDA19|nr:basic proline-rich protein-like [Ammospiza nelsoni]